MTQARSVSANFVLRTYRVTVRVNGSGYGTQDVRIQGTNLNGTALDTTCYVTYPDAIRNCTFTFNHGTRVTLTARPYGSTNWDRWATGGTYCAGTNATCTFTVTGGGTETAVFWDLI